jgi:hypothetical protein
MIGSITLVTMVKGLRESLIKSRRITAQDFFIADLLHN